MSTDRDTDAHRPVVASDGRARVRGPRPGRRARPARHDPTAPSHLVASAEVRRHEHLRKLAIAAAAVVVVGIVGFNLLPSFGVIGGPFTPPSSTGPPAATLGPTPSSSTEIEPGSYVISTPQVRARLTMPAGWSGGETNVWRLPPDGYRGMLELAVTPFEVSLAVADVCTDEVDVDFVEVGPTAEDLTSALANQIGVERSGPTDLMLGGYPTKKFVLTLLPECPGAQGHAFWADATRTYGFAFEARRDGGTVYVVDVNGERLVIASQYRDAASAEDIAQLEAITASIVIEPVPDPAPPTDIGPGGWLAVGKHALTVDGVPLSFSVPTLVQDRGWARYGSLSISKDTIGSQAAEAMIYWTGFPDGGYTDPCADLLDLPAAHRPPMSRPRSRPCPERRSSRSSRTPPLAGALQAT